MGELRKSELNKSLQVRVFLRNERAEKTFAYAQVGRQESQAGAADNCDKVSGGGGYRMDPMRMARH